MKEITPIEGTWSDEANGWVSEILELSGDAWLEVTLPVKGRLVIKKAEHREGPWPKALISKWGGPHFRIRIHHGRALAPGLNATDVYNRYIQIITTVTPERIEYANV